MKTHIPASIKKRVYIAGPMTGYPELNFPAFRRAARDLRAAGVEVVSPVEINGDPAAKWSDCMLADLAKLATCTDIAVLPGWINSPGARIEVQFADRCGLQFWGMDELLFSLLVAPLPIASRMTNPERAAVAGISAVLAS